MRVRAAPSVELQDDPLRERACARVHRLLRARHPRDHVGVGDDPSDAQARQERLREGADRHDLGATQGRERREVVAAIAQRGVGIVLDHDRAVARGEREQRLAAFEGKRLACGILEVRHDEEHARADAELADAARGFGNVEALAIDRYLEHACAVVAERRERVRECRRLRHHDIAGSEIDAAREIDGLERSGAHEHPACVRRDTAVPRGRCDDVAEVGLAFGDAVSERRRAFAAEHRGREIVRANKIERLARRRPDRERHRVARLPRDDPDGLVDERAVDLVLVAACAFGQRRDGAAAHRGQDLDGALAPQIALGQESGVLSVDEYIHEAPERAVPQDPRRELGISIRDLARELRKISDIEVDRRVATGCGAQRGGKAHGDGHASTSAYVARNSSASAAIAGRSELAASVPL